jgi:hypothetical protein
MKNRAHSHTTTTRTWTTHNNALVSPPQIQTLDFYRLTWVMSHVTSFHRKGQVAFLQEVFVSCFRLACHPQKNKCRTLMTVGRSLSTVYCTTNTDFTATENPVDFLRETQKLREIGGNRLGSLLPPARESNRARSAHHRRRRPLTADLENSTLSIDISCGALTTQSVRYVVTVLLCVCMTMMDERRLLCHER